MPVEKRKAFRNLPGSNLVAPVFTVFQKRTGLMMETGRQYPAGFLSRNEIAEALDPFGGFPQGRLCNQEQAAGAQPFKCGFDPLVDRFILRFEKGFAEREAGDDEVPAILGRG